MSSIGRPKAGAIGWGVDGEKVRSKSGDWRRLKRTSASRCGEQKAGLVWNGATSWSGESCLGWAASFQE